MFFGVKRLACSRFAQFEKQTERKKQTHIYINIAPAEGARVRTTGAYEAIQKLQQVPLVFSLAE